MKNKFTFLFSRVLYLRDDIRFDRFDGYEYAGGRTISFSCDHDHAYQLIFVLSNRARPKLNAFFLGFYRPVFRDDGDARQDFV